jgi:hypothetical protein
MTNKQEKTLEKRNPWCVLSNSNTNHCDGFPSKGNPLKKMKVAVKRSTKDTQGEVGREVAKMRDQREKAT